MVEAHENNASRTPCRSGGAVVGNLTPLDLRVALIAAHTNREDLASAYTGALIDALESPEFERLPWRGLDNAKFEATWVIEPVRKSIARDLLSGSQAA